MRKSIDSSYVLRGFAAATLDSSYSIVNTLISSLRISWRVTGVKSLAIPFKVSTARAAKLNTKEHRRFRTE